MGAIPKGNQRAGVILVVDDEATLLSALERAFRREGFYPLSTTTIEGAWKILESALVHVVIADEKLPCGSGAYFLIDVGRRFPNVGRLLLTGFLTPLLEDLAKQNGFVALQKAHSFPELLAAVNRELGADG